MPGAYLHLQSLSLEIKQEHMESNYHPGQFDSLCIGMMKKLVMNILQWGHLNILAFWCCVAGGTSVGFQYFFPSYSGWQRRRISEGPQLRFIEIWPVINGCAYFSLCLWRDAFGSELIFHLACIQRNVTGVDCALEVMGREHWCWVGADWGHAWYSSLFTVPLVSLFVSPISQSGPVFCSSSFWVSCRRGLHGIHQTPFIIFVSCALFFVCVFLP